MVPAPARGAVGELHFVPLRRIREFLAERDDGGVQAQLQNGRDPTTGVALDLRKTVDVPGIEHQRLFADRIGSRAQREATMRIVEVVRRADRDIADLVAAPAKLVDVPIEALELDEEVGVGMMAVDHADRVVRIVGHDEPAANVPHGLHMARRDIPRSPDQRE